MTRNPAADPAFYHGDAPRGVSEFVEPEVEVDVDPLAEVEPPDAPYVSTDAADYASGGGWYEVDGERVQGKAAAQALLDARDAA